MTQSLTHLIQSLLSLPATNPTNSSTGKSGTTIRFDPETRAFIDTQCANLGISIQDFVCMMMKAIRVDSVVTDNAETNQLRIIIQRFFAVFEAHGVDLYDIPKWLPCIKKSDLLNHDVLIDTIDDDVIQQLQELFWVSRDWLLGKINEPYEVHGWYNGIQHIISQVEENLMYPKIYLVSNIALPSSIKESDPDFKEQTLLKIGIIVRDKKYSDGHDINRYKIWSCEPCCYKDLRNQLGELIDWLRKKRVIEYTGIYLQESEFSNIFKDKNFVRNSFRKGKNWEMEDLQNYNVDLEFWP